MAQRTKTSPSLNLQGDAVKTCLTSEKNSGHPNKAKDFTLGAQQNLSFWRATTYEPKESQPYIGYGDIQGKQRQSKGFK